MKTIKELRNERQWTQRQLATALDVTTVTVWNWESGRTVPSVQQLYRIAKVFDVAIGDISLIGVEVDA